MLGSLLNLAQLIEHLVFHILDIRQHLPFFLDLELRDREMLGGAAALSTLEVLKPGVPHMLEKSVLQQTVGFDNLCVAVLVCNLLRGPFFGVANLMDDLFDRSHSTAN